MNLLLINYEFPPIGAGASTATYHIGKELASMDHEVSILTSSYKNKIGRDSQEGMFIYRCPALRKKQSESNIIEMLSFVISAFIFLPWIIKKRQIRGVIIFFSFPCGPLGLWAKLLFGIPYIISLRGGDVPGTEKKLDWIHKVLQPLRRLVFRKSKAVIANSEGLKQLAQKADPIDISIIPNGVDTRFFIPIIPKIKKSWFELLFVGRLSEQKNLMALLKQVSIFKKKESVKLKLHIVGDGPLKKQIQNYAKERDVSDLIIWDGWLDKMAILSRCQKADCFVNPSLYEGMPNAVLEAMACGLPVIASHVAGNNEIVIHGQTGFLFELGDEDFFQESLEKVTKNFDVCTRMGLTARKWVEENYSWEKVATAYFKTFAIDR